jgi:hypothetical protein
MSRFRWDVAPRHVITGAWRFDIAWWSLLQGSKCTACLKINALHYLETWDRITQLCSDIFQKRYLLVKYEYICYFHIDHDIHVTLSDQSPVNAIYSSHVVVVACTFYSVLTFALDTALLGRVPPPPTVWPTIACPALLPSLWQCCVLPCVSGEVYDAARQTITLILTFRKYDKQK